MSKPKRLLFVIDSLGIGGAERQLAELIKGLAHKGGYEIHLVCLLKTEQGYMDQITSIGVQIHYIERAFRYDLPGPIVKVAYYIRSHQIDLVHSFMNMGSLVGCLAAKLTRRPVVCSAIRDGKDQSLMARLSKQFLAKIADRFVANSRAGLANRFSVMQPHFRVVYNGVDWSRFSTKDDDCQDLRIELRLIDRRPVIGMVASLSRNKDHETLLMAAPQILAALPNTVFLLVGDGERRDILKALTEKLGIQHNVTFTGYRRDVDRLYALMDVCILMTNSRIIVDGISNTLTEAMANGIPVVASAGGGTDELIRHGRDGLLVPPHNPEQTALTVLTLLLGPEEKRHQLAMSAKRRVEELFNLERYLQDYENLYIECSLRRP